MNIKDLSIEETKEILKTETSLVTKIIVSHLHELNKEPLIKEAQKDIAHYIEDLNENPNEYYEISVFDNTLLTKLILRKDLNDNLAKYVGKKLFELTEIYLFNQLDESQKSIVLDSLITKNQLKGSREFIKNKIEDNLALVKIENNQLIQSIGLKDIDDKLMTLIGFDYAGYKEIGYAQNNGDMAEYRETILKLKDLFNLDGLAAFIREDNRVALRITKRFGFREISKIKSPYSDNTLVFLVLD